MKTKPIIFSGPMIRALLEGRKTQTRRVLTPDCDEPPTVVINGTVTAFDENEKPYRWPRTHAVGDLLWVREAHAMLPRLAYRISIGTGTIDQREHPSDGYSAAVFREGFDRSGAPRWSPSIHMPRWASRLTLEVTDVRVGRVQSITDADARSEGLIEVTAPNGHVTYQVPDLCGGQTPVRAFRMLWDSIHGSDAWQRNDWIAAYTFTVHHRNVDDLLAEREVAA